MKVCPVRTVRTSAGGGGLDRAVRVFEAEPSVDPGRRQQRLEVLLPEHDADLGALAHAAREPPDGGAVPRQIAQRLAHDAGGDTVLAHHLGDARAEERRGDRDHTAGHDALGVGERDPEHHAAHGVTNAVHHRRLAAIQPGEFPAQLLEFAPEALDLLLERQPRTRAAEVVNLEPGRRGQAAPHAHEAEAAAHDALEQDHRMRSRPPLGLRYRRGAALRDGCFGRGPPAAHLISPYCGLTTLSRAMGAHPARRSS